MWERVIPEDMSTVEAGFLNDLMESMESGWGSHILDILCGFGRLAVPLAKRGYHLTCVDISERFILSLDEKVKEENLSIRN